MFNLSMVEDGHEVSMRAKEKLITPTKKARVDLFVDTMDKSVDDTLMEMAKNRVQGSFFYAVMRWLKGSSMHDYNVEKNPIGTMGIENQKVKRNFKRYKKMREAGRREDIEKLYQDYNTFLAISDKNREVYFKKLSKEGYNAIVDDNDKGGYGSISPVIVFDAKKSLAVNKITKITDKMADEALDAHANRSLEIEKAIEYERALGWSDK